MTGKTISHFKNTFFFIAIFVIIFYSADLVQAQISNNEIVNTIKEELKLNKGKTMGKSSGKIFHVYSIDVPVDAVIEDSENEYIISPVYVTMAYRPNNNKIEKISEAYKVKIYKNPKQSYASFNPSYDFAGGEKTKIIWAYENDSKIFKAALDGLPSLKDTDLDLIYGEKDYFPSEWK